MNPPPLPNEYRLPPEARKQGWMILAIIGFCVVGVPLFIIAAVVSRRPSPTPQRSRAQIEASVEADMQKAAPSRPIAADSAACDACSFLEKNGSLRLDRDLRKAWIDPLVWLQLDAQQKEQATLAIAICVSPANPMVTLYDSRSAREIASYGQFQGFVVK
jgi:hypothetical protein